MTDLATAEDALPWEVQPSETERAYNAFCVYRDLGPRRTLVKTARIYYDLGENADVPGTSPKLRQIKTWSATYGWVGRAHAWDIHVDEEARLDQIEAVKEMRKRHAAVANMTLGKAAERLRTAPTETLSIADAARLLDLAVKVERMARGEPDRVSQVQGPDGSPIQVQVDQTTVEALEARLTALLIEAEADDGDAPVEPD